MKKLFYLLALLFITSCSDDIIDNPGLNIESKSYIASSHKVSEQQAINTILSHFKALQESAISRGDTPTQIPQIHNVSVITSNDLGIDTITRADLYIGMYDTLKSGQIMNANAKVYVDSLFYIINFENKEGFAILSTDTRTDPIYAIIDEGNFNTEELRKEDNPGFLNFLEESVCTLLKDVSDPQKASNSQNGTKRYWQTFPGDLECDDYSDAENKLEKVEPMLNTRWGQNSPYNLYCPNRFPTGCTVTAVAQILSYYQTIDNIAWEYNNRSGSAKIDWQQVINECKAFRGQFYGSETYGYSKYAHQIANLMMYLGVSFNAKYKKDGTEVKSNKPIEWLNSFGEINATKLGDFKASKVQQAIKSGNLVYARGNERRIRIFGITIAYKDGHAWVCDGYIRQYGFHTVEKLYVHCNWGWNGSRNGYFLSKAFNTNNAYEFDDDTEYPEDGSNFKYNIQCSILSKK